MRTGCGIGLTAATLTWQGVGVEQLRDAGAGDDDAGVPVAGGENAKTASLEMEASRVAAAG